MSQVTIDGERVAVSREVYCQFCEEAAAKKRSVEDVAKAKLRPAKKAPAKKRARKAAKR